MNYGVSNTISFVKVIRNSAEKYNIENAITSRHLNARCQSGVIRMKISHRFRKCQKIGKNKNYGISNTIIFLMILEILLRNTILKTQ